MRQHTVTDSPYGPLTLVADDGVLSGLYMDRPAPPPARGDLRRPRRRPLHGDEGTAGRLLRGRPQGVHRPPAPARHALPAPRVGRTPPHPLRRDPHLRRTRRLLGSPKASRAVGLANGRNPVGDHRPLPPRHRLHRQPHRLRRRPAPQTAPAGLRTRIRPVLRAAGRQAAIRRSSAGSDVPIGSRTTSSARSSYGVGSALTTISRAPWSTATWARPAAGWTWRLVPAAMKSCRPS